MGKHRKVYMIVTNDEYEHPVAMDIVGKQACADFLGIKHRTLYNRLRSGTWYGEYKAIDLGYEEELDDLIPNENAVILSDEERNRKIEYEKRKKHEKCEKNKRINARNDYIKNKEKYKKKSLNYYYDHRQERCEYGKKRRKEMKMMKNTNKYI